MKKSTLYIVVIAQPQFDTSNYKGSTLLSSVEKIVFAEAWSNGVRSLPFILDLPESLLGNDASLKKTTPTEEIIGHATGAFIDEKGNLYIIGELDLRDARVQRIQEDLAMGLTWGAGFWTINSPMFGGDERPTKYIPRMQLSRNPAYGPQGTWIVYNSLDPTEFRSILQRTFFSMANAYVPKSVLDRFK